MRIENIKSVYDVYPAKIVNTQYTTLIDPNTHKRIVNIETHTVELYDSKGNSNEWTNKHSIDKQA